MKKRQKQADNHERWTQTTRRGKLTMKNNIKMNDDKKRHVMMLTFWPNKCIESTKIDLFNEKVNKTKTQLSLLNEFS